MLKLETSLSCLFFDSNLVFTIILFISLLLYVSLSSINNAY